MKKLATPRFIQAKQKVTYKLYKLCYYLSENYTVIKTDFFARTNHLC